MRRHLIFQAVSATIMLAGFVAALLLCSRLVTQEKEELRRTTQTEAHQIAIQLQSGIRTAVEPLERLGAWWLSQGKPTAGEDWRTDGQLFLSHSPGLREASWIGVGGYRYWVAKPGANPDTQKTWPSDDRIRSVIGMSQTLHAMAVSEIFDAADIGPAIYVCFPGIKQKRVRGYIVGLYDAKALIASVAEGGVRPDNHITVTSAGRLIYSSAPRKPLAQTQAEASFGIAGTTWKIALHAPLSYFREFRELTATVAGVVGALVYAFGMLLYISQRRSLELQRSNAENQNLNRELNRKLEDFKALLDVIPIGIAVADAPDCRHIRMNPALANMLGMRHSVDLSKENVSKSGPDAGKLRWRMIRNGQELRPEEMPMQKAAATGKEVLGGEDQIVREDGSIIHVLSFAAPLFDEGGRVRGVLNACVDVSERKAQEQVRLELEQRLHRAQRMKSLGVMAAGIAHDFNNLLTSIIGQASLALDDVPEGSPAAQHVNSCLEAANKAARLVHQVLAYTGNSYHTLRPTGLGDVIRDSENELAALAPTTAHVHVSIAPQLPPVLADPDEVRQALQNLVENAVEATTSEHNRIEIHVDHRNIAAGTLDLSGEELKPGAYVRVAVKDHGLGMPDEIAEKAFDPFFTTKFLGRGLGLSEVMGIMHAHDGAVALETTPNGGTSVFLYFPIEPRESPKDDSPSPAQVA